MLVHKSPPSKQSWNFRNLFLRCSPASEASGAGAGPLCGRHQRGLRGAAERLGVAAQRRLPHVHSQPPAALLILLRVLAVRLRQRKNQTHTAGITLESFLAWLGDFDSDFKSFAHCLQDSDSAPPHPVPPAAMHPYPTFPPLGLALPPGLSMGTGKPSIGGHPLLMHPGSQVC